MASKIVDIMEFKACMAVTKALSTNEAAWQRVCGGWASKSVFNTDATIWCICSQIALDCGFLFVVGTNFMFNNCKSCWKANLVNSSPLSWMNYIGQVLYRESRICSNHVAMCLLDFSMILAISTRLIVVLMHIRAKNSTSPFGFDAGYGPIRSMAAYSHEAPSMS